jgi:penicillin-binding protein 2
MKREKILSGLMLGLLLVTFSGLVFVQVVMHEKYRAMSENNRLRVVPLPAPRGTIYDRNGSDIAKDELSFNVSLKRAAKATDAMFIRGLSEVLGIEEKAVYQKLKETELQPFISHTIAEDVGIEKAIRISEMGTEYPGIFLEVTTRRRYLKRSSCSNVLGYVGLINREEFQRLKPYGFRMNDLMGRSGLERHYDDYIRGKHGGKQVEVDNRGREVRVLGLKEPVPGKSLQLTIDIRLQEFCDSLLEGRRGAIVAISPQTGEIFALSSAPSFDPNAFVDSSRGREVSGFLGDKHHPLVNRAVSGTYPAGSVFKPVMAVAALESGVINDKTFLRCDGSLVSGGRTFHCWYKNGHGDIDLREAIKVSCNVFFWRVGLLLGADKIAEQASKMGIGSRSGVDLPFEASGLLPSEAWKKKTMKEPWYAGETLNLSVGQGYLLATPLQVARMASVLANGGYLIKPYIVEKIEGVRVGAAEKVSLGISKKNLDSVRDGMRLAVNDRRGTGKKALQKDFVVSGKTGTAQTSRNEDHGWFMGFAPFDNAKLTVVVFDEYGGKGGYFAAETAGKIFNKAREIGLI